MANKPHVLACLFRRPAACDHRRTSFELDAYAGVAPRACTGLATFGVNYIVSGLSRCSVGPQVRTARPLRCAPRLFQSKSKFSSYAYSKRSLPHPLPCCSVLQGQLDDRGRTQESHGHRILVKTAFGALVHATRRHAQTATPSCQPICSQVSYDGRTRRRDGISKSRRFTQPGARILWRLRR